MTDAQMKSASLENRRQPERTTGRRRWPPPPSPELAAHPRHPPPYLQEEPCRDARTSDLCRPPSLGLVADLILVLNEERTRTRTRSTRGRRMPDSSSSSRRRRRRHPTTTTGPTPANPDGGLPPCSSSSFAMGHSGLRGGGGRKGRTTTFNSSNNSNKPIFVIAKNKKTTHDAAAGARDDDEDDDSLNGSPTPPRSTRILLVLVGIFVAFAVQYVSSVGRRFVDALGWREPAPAATSSSSSSNPFRSHDGDGNGNPDVLEEDPRSNSKQARQKQKSRPNVLNGAPGRLRPRDLPGPELFKGFDGDEKKVAVVVIGGDGGDTQTERRVSVPYRQGRVLQINRLSHRHPPVFSTVTHLPQLVPRNVVQQLVEVLERHADELDEDPDTVDGMPTYEVFVDSVDLRQHAPTIKVRDDPRHRDAKREALRAKLQKLTEPYADRMTQIVRNIHPDLCNVTLSNGENRFCTPCYSLIRRYRHGERTSHPPHYDGHARVTMVVSLSDYDDDYTGGLYVATGHGPQREYFPLSRGDAVLHPSTLLHGVHVYPSSTQPRSRTIRWSWIVWFRDSETCQDHSIDWFKDCADQGNPLCQQFQASKVVHQYTENDQSSNPNRDPVAAELEASRQIMDLNLRAAHGGAAESAVKVARAYLKQLPSELELNVEEARRHYQIAIDSHSSEGHYGMAQILVAEASSLGNEDREQQHDKLREAVSHLERAAVSMHAFASFNLGIAHIYGYGVPRVNMERGVEWLVQSGLPEGLFLASQYAASVGDRSRHDKWLRRATILGWDQPWRVQARKHTGSGGAAGVDLNLMWPPSVARGGIQPPEL